MDTPPSPKPKGFAGWRIQREQVDSWCVLHDFLRCSCCHHLDFGVKNELVLLFVVGAPTSRRHSLGLREWQPGECQPSAVTVRGAVTARMGCFSPFASPSPRGSFVCTAARLFRPRSVLHPSSN